MGREISTRAQIKDISAEGKLHLDSKSLAFVSPELKWTVELDNDLKVEAADGWLIVSLKRDKAKFEIGEDAAKWANAILNPPTRLSKLGVKPSMRYWISGKFEPFFPKELKSFGAVETRKPAECDIAFLYVSDRAQLADLAHLAKSLRLKVNVWIVWPKGSATISQSQVLEAAAQLQMGPSKTAAFDDRHSSMRFAKKA